MKRVNKRILSVCMATVFAATAFVFAPVTVGAAWVGEWSPFFNGAGSKLTRLPESGGTLVIENPAYDDAFFERNFVIEKTGAYKVSAEVKLENAVFETDKRNPSLLAFRPSDVTKDGNFAPIASNVAVEGGKWTTVSISFAAAKGDVYTVRLLFGVAKGKAAFRNVRFEADAAARVIIDVTADNRVVSRNKMAERTYDVKKDAEWAKTARNLDIRSFGLPAAIGKTTLTYDGAFALVGKSPEEIAKSVKTVGDVLQYFIASRFVYGRPKGDYPDYDGIHQLRGLKDEALWYFEPTGAEQLSAGWHCCCGGMGAAVAYLLAGDYDKSGVIQWRSDEESPRHVINWVQTGGKYYTFDFVALCDDGRYDLFDYPAAALDKLEDFGASKAVDWYRKNWYADCAANKTFNLIFAYECAETMYPIWTGDSRQYTSVTLPTFAKGKVTIIKQDKSAAGIKYRDVALPKSYNYWG